MYPNMPSQMPMMAPTSAPMYPYQSNRYMMPTAYNSSTFQNLSPSRRQEIMRYYQKVNQNETPKVPITLSWNVNAYIELKKENVFKRCCNSVKGKFKGNTKQLTSLQPNVFQNTYLPPQTNYTNQGYKYNTGGKSNPYESYNLTGYNQQASENEATVKHILKDVSGIVKPGQLCAIMGASGAGKTTLLNVLNFRNRGKIIIDGDIKINGKTVTWREITACSGYVQQEDVFIGTLKVKEHLTFLAMMKIGKNVSDKQKRERVEQVMTEMNLLHVQETIIGQGDRLRGISGGEKRRLAFASEVLTNPQLLFCDEPTSGLDSFMAQSIVDSMSFLARQGKTVISTIHQPSSQIFEKFDTLCLLGEGRVAYFGPTKDAPQFFQSIGKPCPPLYNPADHYIQVLAIMPNTREQCLRNANAICDTYDRSTYKQNVLASMNATNAQNQNNETEKIKKNRYNSSFLNQTKWLLWRQSINSIREPITGKVMVIQTVFVGIFLGLIYLQLKHNEKGVMNRNGVLFILLMQTGFGYIFPVINSFPLELAVFYRESKNRVYSVLPYYVAKQLSELPKFIILPFTMITITYWMADVNKDAKVYIVITLILVLSSQVSLGFGFLLSITAPNTDAAVGLAAPLLLPLLIFAGFFLNNSSVPDYFVWLKYISFFFYANEAYTIELWQDVKSIDCSIPNPSPDCRSARCYRNGDDVLAALSVSKSNYDRDIGLLILLLVVPRIAGYFILRFKAKRL